jgi:hypothetical protein
MCVCVCVCVRKWTHACIMKIYSKKKGGGKKKSLGTHETPVSALARRLEPVLVGFR